MYSGLINLPKVPKCAQSVQLLELLECAVLGPESILAVFGLARRALD
jgi:hypothetical protein